MVGESNLHRWCHAKGLMYPAEVCMKYRAIAAAWFSAFLRPAGLETWCAAMLEKGWRLAGVVK